MLHRIRRPYLAPVDDDDLFADLLHRFENVRNEQNHLPVSRELLQQATEQLSRRDIESGERFVKHQQIRIVQQRGCYQDTLLHTLSIGRNRCVPVRVKGKKPKQFVGLFIQYPCRKQP